MKEKWKFPPIGLRIVKSVLAVGGCYLISYARGNSGIVFYSQLAALWCIQTYVSNTKKMAIQRTIGTVVGALYGLLVILLRAGLIPDGSQYGDVIFATLVTVTTGIILYTTVCIKKEQASYFSCVVFLSIVINHIADQNPYLFVWDRFLDTMIGIALGMGMNCISLPGKKRRDILFVSGLDDTLLNKNDNLSAYSRIELNRMLEDGILFTIATLRTPASILEVIGDIRLKCPVIAMDGAVLYDPKEHRYLKSYVISGRRSRELIEQIRQAGMECFVNSLVEDTLLIYYQDYADPVYMGLVEKMRKSPFRNYIKKELPEEEDVLYLMVLEQKKKVEALYEDLCRQGYHEKYKILIYDSNDYQGYTYLKIYNKNASKQHMLKYLAEMLGTSKIVTFGSIAGKYDVLIEPGDSNRVVKTVKKLYEPNRTSRALAKIE